MDEEGTGGSAGWAHLDRDTFAAVVGYLKPREAAALACTCRYARGVARDNTVWAPLLARHFGLHLQAPDNAALVSLFRSLYGACQSAGGAGGRPLAGAVQLEGLYTDGGMDMDDPAFWAGNVFQPNGWAIYCSRAGSNVHCVGLLKAVRLEDPSAAAHRAQLISIASDVGWLLFLGRVPSRALRRQLAAAAPGPASAGELCARLRAAMRRSLSHWSTHGLERFTWQLALNYIGLRNPQLQQGQHLAAGPGPGVMGGANAQLFAQLPELVLQLVAGPGAGLNPALDVAQAQAVGREQGFGPLGGAEARSDAPPVHAAQQRPQPAQEPKPQEQQQQQGETQKAVSALAQQEQEQQQQQLTPLPSRLVAILRDIFLGRSASGNRALFGLGEAAEGEGLQVWTRSARDYLGSPALEHTTAIIDGITVSRTGEFTCPVACGALFLAQRGPAAGLRRAAAAAAAPAAAPTGPAATAPTTAQGAGDAAQSEAAIKQKQKLGQKLQRLEQGSQQQQQQKLGKEKKEKEQQQEQQAMSERQRQEVAEQAPVQQEFVEMVRQPYVQAMSDLTSLAAVEAAAAAGLLPPVAARGSCPGAGEWVEFRRPPPPPSSSLHQPQPLRLPPARAAAGADDTLSAAMAAAARPPLGNGAGAANREVSEGPGASCEAAAEGGGVLWPVVWFRFFPHDGLGDEGDQGMALPPVLPPPPPLDEPDPDLDLDMAPGPNPDLDGAAGSDDGSGGGEEGEEEDGDGLGENGEDGSSSTTLGSSSSSSDSSSDDDNDGGGGEGDGDDDFDMLGNGTDTEEWENELDFLYGIEGQPNSYNATALHTSSDEDDEMAAAVHPYGGADADGAAAAAAGPGPSSATEGPPGSAALAGLDGALAMGSDSGEPGPLHCQEPDQHRRQPPARHQQRKRRTADGAEGGGGGGGAGPSRPADGGADRATDAAAGGGAAAAAASYGITGELLDGVPVLTWLNHLTKPNVAGGVLNHVADAAGVQALRHTFQDVQTALQPSAKVPATPWRRGGEQPPAAPPAPPHPEAAAAAAAAAAPGSVAGQAAPQIAPSTAAAVAAVGREEAPLAVLLPPEESAEHAFEGMEAVPPLVAAPLLPWPPPQAGAVGIAGGAADGSEAAAAAPPPPQQRPPSGHLCMPLRQRWCGNTVLFKMIAPEDRTAEFGEEADTPPNIDVQFLALRGLTLSLRPPLRLLGG